VRRAASQNVRSPHRLPSRNSRIASHRHNIAAEWDDILRDLDRLQEIELEQDGKRFLLRTPTTGVAGKLFQAVGVALPPNLQELPLHYSAAGRLTGPRHCRRGAKTTAFVRKPLNLLDFLQSAV